MVEQKPNRQPGAWTHQTWIDFCKFKGWYSGDNPAAWSGNLKHALAAPSDVVEVKHFTALSYDQMPDFIAQLRQRGGVAARALEVLT